jgi:hypothetical protein
MVNSVKKSVKVSFNETKYEFKLDRVIETGTDEVRRRYKILINGEADSRLLLVSTMPDKPLACYTVLEPIHRFSKKEYTSPYKQYYEKDFPMDIVFSIVTFLNK